MGKVEQAKIVLQRGEQVTTQEKKKWLSRYRPTLLELDRLINERQRWIDRATKITTSISDMPKGMSEGGSLQAAIENAVVIDSKINAAYEEAEQIRQEILEAIATVDDLTLRMVLKYIYIDGLKYKEITKIMTYDRTNLWRLHNRAVEKINLQHIAT